jgi:hypothetical protein
MCRSDSGLILIGVLTLHLILNDEVLLRRQSGGYVDGVIVHGVVADQHLGSLLDGQVLSVGDVTLGAVAALASLVAGVGVRAGHHALLLLLLTTQVVLLV